MSRYDRALPRYEPQRHEDEFLRFATEWVRWSDLVALLPPEDGQP